MADIDIASLIANAGKTNADFNFGKINEAYYKGLENAYQQRTRDAFQDPSLYGPDGQIDPYKAVQAALKAGGTAGVGPAKEVAGIADVLSQFGNSANLDRRLNPNAPLSPYERNPPNSPPSLNRPPSAPADPDSTSTVRPAPTVRGGGDKSGSLVSFLDANGVSPENQGDHIVNLSAAISKATGKQYDPNTPLDRNDPRVRSVLADWIRNPTPQTQAPQPQTVAPAPQTVAPAPQTVTPAPTVAPGPQTPIVPTPVTTQTIRPTTAPALPDPTLNGIVSKEELAAFGSPQGTLAAYEAALRRRLPAETQKEVQSIVDAIRNALKLTTEQQNAQTPGSISDYEGQKTAAVEQAKAYAEKDKTIVDNGLRGHTEIPQLQLLQSQMADPNFFSGVGEKYNLLYKRLKSAIGLDPDAAVPQEILRKVTASNVLSSLGNLRGLGPVRVAEMNMAREAQAAPDNSVPANQLLTEISIRTHQRNTEIADMRNAYLETHPSIDRGFDKQVTDYMKTHPLFSDAEIRDWHKAISTYKPTAPTTAPNQPAAKQYNRAEYDKAVASGALKKGDTFIDDAGRTRRVP